MLDKLRGMVPSARSMLKGADTFLARRQSWSREGAQHTGQPPRLIPTFTDGNRCRLWRRGDRRSPLSPRAFVNLINDESNSALVGMTSSEQRATPPRRVWPAHHRRRHRQKTTAKPRIHQALRLQKERTQSCRYGSSQGLARARTPVPAQSVMGRHCPPAAPSGQTGLPARRRCARPCA